MIIDIFADVVCPWCYIGKRRLELALEQRPELAVERRWRPFQLQPDLPAAGMPWPAFVREKFGGPERAGQLFAHVSAIGAADGLRLDFDHIASEPNTRDAHRLILFASGLGREWQLADRLFAAHFAEGRDLSDTDALVDAAVSAGLGEVAVRDVLEGDAYAAEVAASQRDAAHMGIGGVPFYILDGRYAISGAQPIEVFLRGLDLAYAEKAL